MIDKLIKVQAELKAPKNQTNAFGKYKYRSAEDIIEAVKPLLHREGLLMTITDKIILAGGASTHQVSAPRYYIEATVTVTDGTKEQKVSAFAREEESQKGMSVAQITGAASSYARKYALNGMFAIDDTKDADSTNTHGKDEKVAYPEPADDINFD